ncbi:MAG: histidine--tRNA ligase [bacterium]|nr:histidine--tRNA ligase [bacterium]
MSDRDAARPTPRIPRGFRDLFAADLAARRQMVQTIIGVYERFGFEALDTPAFEYLDVLGKFLPESDTPAGGVFALRDDDEQWMALRYDHTAPLSRFYAQHGNRLTNPFRRYQVGPVWRQEKPGPGRFREFYQCDFDTVGTDSMVADAEICAVVATCFEALGIGRGDYILKVNNRKVLGGVLDAIGLPQDQSGGRLTVLRAIDKLDRLGEDGVRLLLGKGRMDASGDYTRGAGLAAEQIEIVMGYLGACVSDRQEVCGRLRELVGGSEEGEEGVRELEEIHDLLDAMDLGPDQVLFDPSVVRGLAYYTGPVVEAVLTFEVEEDGEKRELGSLLGGGRYDDLVERFTGEKIPATGASIGVDRLLAALEALGRLEADRAERPVVITIFERDRMADYQRMASDLRSAGIAAELYLGKKGFRQQLKYADKRDSPVAVIAGSNEFEGGTVTLKDLRLGKKLSREITDREKWKEQPAQVSVKREDLVSGVRSLLERHS